MYPSCFLLVQSMSVLLKVLAWKYLRIILKSRHGCQQNTKNSLDILKEFKEKEISKIGLFIYSGDNPSRIVAISRCVPIFLAEHY
jgi:hypothetical protein